MERQKDRQKDGQIVIYRNLKAMDRAPIKYLTTFANNYIIISVNHSLLQLLKYDKISTTAMDKI